MKQQRHIQTTRTLLSRFRYWGRTVSYTHLDVYKRQSLYSSKLGVDIFYRRTGNDYKIHKIRGFSDDIPSNYSEDFSGIKVDIKGPVSYTHLSRRIPVYKLRSKSKN